MFKTTQTAQIKKIHGVATWLENAWLAINEPNSEIEAVDVRELVKHLKGLKRDSIPELIAAARDTGDETLGDALCDGEKLEGILGSDLDSIAAPAGFEGKTILTPLFAHGDPIFWRGGEQPVSDETIVHVVTMDALYYANMPAKFFDWGKRTDGREILAFVIEKDLYKHLRLAAKAGRRVEYKDPRGFWRESGFTLFPDSFLTTEPVELFRVAKPSIAPEEMHRHLSLSLLSRHGEPITWTGGEQPVCDDVHVDVVTNNGHFFPGLKACHFDWEKTGPFGIHAYIVRNNQNHSFSMRVFKTPSIPGKEIGFVKERIPAFLLKGFARPNGLEGSRRG